MLGRTVGAVLLGVEARLIEVEVDLGGGLPNIAAVGLPDSAVREGIDRIRAALPHAGFQLPQHRVTLNLAPAELRKQGTGLDLPMAVALLAADGQLPENPLRATVLAGELALDGALRPVRGALPVALAVRREGLRRLIVPRANASEAALVDEVEVFGATSLADAIAVLRGGAVERARPDVESGLDTEDTGAPDLADVRGQAAARRALEIAAAGGHHLLLEGPPGGGKTLLARRLAGILPPLSLEEALEVTQTWSAAGLASGLVTRRPFRSPHHGISPAGFTGGGSRIRPGEIALASGGVLYLDELPEFRRDVLEALRQPLEEGTLTIVRLHSRATLPARFGLVASMNPCPCGWHGAPQGRCRCSPAQVHRYRGRVSGPLFDRFDLVAAVPPVALEDLAGAMGGEPSSEVRRRVARARGRQVERFGPGGPRCNAGMAPADLERHTRLASGPRRLLLAACERLRLTARGFDRVRRVARTLADLDGSAAIGEEHVAEAVQYRRDPGTPTD